MSPAPSGATRLVALLGDPVRHSLSPRFQNAAFRALALDAVYVALRCSASDLPGLLRGLARSGGAGNVTVPHKARAADLLDVRSPRVESTGACNTFWSDDEGAIHGDNTDVHGFRVAARSVLRSDLRDATVALLGAGGSARAVLEGCRLERVGRLLLWNRTPERARALASAWGRRTPALHVLDRLDELAGVDVDLLVNATAAGLDPSADPPLPPATTGIGASLDLAYAAGGGTRWNRRLRERGVPTADGSLMLLHQGAEAFRLWWGLEAPLSEMARALDLPAPEQA